MEIGVALDPDADRAAAALADAALDAAFARIAQVQTALSRFDARSEIGRFNEAPAGTAIAVGVDAAVVLAAAAELGEASDGLFDVTLGSGLSSWSCSAAILYKHASGVRLDLGGIAKGHAVDVAVAVLQASGIDAGWVNAGGDLRVFGALSLPIDLRDERSGGVRRFALLEDGAFATSRLATPGGVRGAVAANAPRHVSVASGLCLWADALTKVVALSGDPGHPALAARSARAWLH